MRIGVDVGGTNTDAVLIDGRTVVASVKWPTSPDISSGIRSAIGSLLTESGVSATQITGVMIGTTHFTNAFVQAKHMRQVAAIRIGFPAARGIPPFADWPTRMRDATFGSVAMIAGGYQFDGRAISDLDESGLVAAARDIKRAGLSDIAITRLGRAVEGVRSPA